MRIQMNGWSISYDTAGEGLPLIFIHGFPLSRKVWEPQISGLASYARVILPDLRGHGDSDALPGPYSMDTLAEDCISLMNNLGITQPALVCGLSMGGYVAFAMYRKFADRIAGLILSATRAAGESDEGKAARETAITTAKNNGVNAIADSMLHKMFAPATYASQPDLVHRVQKMMVNTSVNGMVGALEAMRDRPDSTPMLSNIHKPVLILHGEKDQLIPAQKAYELHAAIPGSELVVLENAGHLLNLEKPVEYNQEIRRFLKRF